MNNDTKGDDSGEAIVCFVIVIADSDSMFFKGTTWLKTRLGWPGCVLPRRLDGGHALHG